MVIRRRLTIEEFEGEEGSPRTETNAPARLVRKPPTTSSDFTSDSTEASREGSAQTSNENPAATEPVGRTYADIVAASVKDPRMMALIITFLSFAVFSPWTSNLELLLNPLVVALVCNFVWFLFPLVQKIQHWYSGIK